MISSCPLHTSLLDLAERLLGLFFAQMAGKARPNLGQRLRRRPEVVSFAAVQRAFWSRMLHLRKTG